MSAPRGGRLLRKGLATPALAVAVGHAVKLLGSRLVRGLRGVRQRRAQRLEIEAIAAAMAHVGPHQVDDLPLPAQLRSAVAWRLERASERLFWLKFR